MTTAIRKHLRDFIAILALVAIALGRPRYILTQQRLRFPLIEEKPFVAEGRVRRTRQARHARPGPDRARGRACAIGDIGKVELKDGRALVHMEIEQEYEDLVHRDATALLRPRTGLKDMFVAARPGHDVRAADRRGRHDPGRRNTRRTWTRTRSCRRSTATRATT